MKKFYIEIKKRTSVFTIYLVYHIKKLMVFNNKETVISNITCNGKLKEHHRGRPARGSPAGAAAIFRRRQILGPARGWEASSRGRCGRSMGRAGRGGGEGEAGQGRLGGAEGGQIIKKDGSLLQ